jgi:hypothetical protein
VRKPEGKKLVARSRHSWVYNIEMDVIEIGRGSMDWIHLAQDGDHCEHGNQHSGSIKYWEVLEFSRRAQLHEVS